MSGAQPTIGDVLAQRYELRELLGTGTLGPTFKGFDQQRGRTVVVKILPEVYRKRSALVKRFVQHYKDRLGREEAGHARIYDVGLDDGIPYAITEFLEGLSLRRIVEARLGEGMPFALAEVEPMVEDICQILARMHPEQWHGSLKPTNVFLLPDRLVLTDDGLMEILPPEVFARVQIKSEHAAPYLAPEILSDAAGISHETDVFGLGALTYMLCAGKDPDLPLTGIASLRDDMPAGLDDLVRRALSDQPEDRYPTVMVMLLELARLTGDEARVRTLEGVVEAEAMAAAEREMRRSRETEAPPAAPPTEPPVESLAPPPAPEVPAPPAPPSAEPDRTADLFEDPDVAAEGAPAAPPVALGRVGAAPQPDEPARDDLLQPPPPIGRRSGSRVGLVIGLVLLLAGTVLGLGLAGVVPVPGLPDLTAERVPEIDPRLQAAVERVLDSIETSRGRIRETSGEAAARRDDYQAAAASMERARAALAAGDPAQALEEAQQADAAFQAVFEALQKEAAARARAEAAARAETTRAETARPAESRAASPVRAARPACPEGMIEIPAGSFRFGSPPEDLLRDITEHPLETRRTGAYCIDTYEYPNRRGARPHNQVGVRQAAELCTQAGKRLCSEVEWERACKGPQNRDFPYGSQWDPNACNTETASGEDRSLAPAGQFASCRSGYGAFDMSGNVMEWTADTLDRGLAIAKGGSHMRPDYAARCAYRYTAPADTRDVEIGFRCCADLR